MKRAALVLAFSLLSGLTAHQTWYAARQPSASDTLEEQLLWMRTRLQLDSRQFARLKALHEEVEPHLRQLGDEVARLRSTTEAFEEERRTSGEVDFLAFADLVKERRTVDQQCGTSTRELVAAAVQIMTPEQRTRYLEMIAPALEAQDPNAASIH